MAEGSQDFLNLVQDITNLRVQSDEAYQTFVEAREISKIAQLNLEAAQERGLDTSQLSSALNEATGRALQFSNDLDVLIQEETVHIQQLFSAYPAHASAVAQLNDAVPILFFPVRVETVFENQDGANPELWVRIFPDSIAVDTHEEMLTQDEIDAGKAYWEAWVVANDTEKLQAWDVICRGYSHERAAWVVLKTTPVTLSPLPAPADIDFPVLIPKTDSWTEQPVTRIMPDAFVVLCYNDQPGIAYTAQTVPLPDEIKVGLDPNKETTFEQFEGDIKLGDPNDPNGDTEIDWLLDFGEAIKKGLGVRIQLSNEDYNSGFKRILVLGVKTSLTAAASQKRLEGLIDSHHYTDGFSLLKQGTPTNNTDAAPSGYSSVDLGNVITHDTERKGPLFTETASNVNKLDGQILCEALGIEYDPLFNILQSNGEDINSAIQINNGLWQVSIASYVNDMLTPLFDHSMEADLRDFFTDFVRARGALPSIRSGIQPYGILPATAYSRINWQNDPRAGLYSRLQVLTQNLAAQWTQQVQDLVASSIDNPGQNLSDMLSQSAVSLDYMQRVGVGSGYVWNTLAYDFGQSIENNQFDEWRNNQQARMSEMEGMLGVPFSPRPRIAQMNFLKESFPMQVPLVAEETLKEDAPLPNIGGGQNYLQILARSPFTELRNGSYSALGGNGLGGSQPMLFQYARQSLLLEYFEAACNLLGIPPEDRLAPELVNVETQAPPQNRGGNSGPGQDDFQLFAGSSRWAVFEQPFENFGNVGTFLDSGAARNRPETVNLFKAKNGLEAISTHSVGSLKLLTSEVIDATAYRLDTWRLALVNQRLNALRGIADGNPNRTKGIYLGAYGWLENIQKQGTKVEVAPPTNNFVLPNTPTAPLFSDSASHGFIHAPSINQAVTGAVLRSGYMNRANDTEASPLSINISSERIRAALLLLEGVRNGQELGVLLGYEFERRLHENHEVDDELDFSIKYLREEYAINNTIIPFGGAGPDEVKARNVVNGEAVINAHRQGELANFLNDPNNQLKFPQPNGIEAILQEADWISNLMDATGDLTVAEGAFHIVQGNPVKASGLMDAMSKGTNTIPEMDVIQSQKTGLYVTQRFTLHLTAKTAAANGWPTTLSPKAAAEPYLNRWAGELLGDPANIKCKITANAGTPNAVESEFSLDELELSALDFVLSVNDTLQDDDSEIALRIRKAVRKVSGYSHAVPINISFDTSVDASDGLLSFAQIHPLALSIRDFITVSRPLNTLDYIPPTEALEVEHDFNLAEFHTRVVDARMAYNAMNDALQTAFDNLIQVLPALPPSTVFKDLHIALYEASFYGLENALYEFEDETEEHANNLRILATAVLSTSSKTRKKIKYEIDVPTTFDPDNPVTPGNIPPEERVAYVEKGQEILKLVFGKSFNALPLFKIRQQEYDPLNRLLSSSPGPLLDDHSGSGSPFGPNPHLVEEWISSIARVRKNAERYEWLTILSSVVSLDAFSGTTGSNRKAVALQLPYDASVGSPDRWLGAAVENPAALKFGRVAYGTSLPAGHSFAGYQVGMMVDEWVDVIPDKDENTGIAFHQNQPNAKAPQCLLLGLTPAITGHWQWDDLVDMLNETFDMARTRAVTYEQISQTPVGHLFPGMAVPISLAGASIGLSGHALLPGSYP